MQKKTRNLKIKSSADKILEKTFENQVKVIDISFSLKNSILKKLELLPDNYSILVLTLGENYNSVITSLCEILLKDEEFSGVFVTANKHPDFIERLLEQNVKGINLEKLHFIDCVSSTPSQNPRVTSCNSQSLIELNIAIKQLISKKPELKFLVFDSISTLTIYNDPKVIKKFIKAVLEFCYEQKLKTIFLTAKTASIKELIEETSVFFDASIDSEKL